MDFRMASSPSAAAAAAAAASHHHHLFQQHHHQLLPPGLPGIVPPAPLFYYPGAFSFTQSIS